ncbi:MAG TPA: LuxR C-terminal-related transcriptional regulator [Candidatus Baltobacteraceae bacterium]|jgi:ATP/maltotriose-dependent transcriptional regulator MalT
MDLSPRLSTIVDRALQYRITEIVAPAGFGKTTVLNELTSKRGFRLASIRPNEDAVLALMRALCEAVSSDLPDLLRALPEAFQNASASRSDLGAWFAESIRGKDYKIAVDDVHHLGDDATALQLLSLVVDSTEGESQWVLASRTWAQLPTVEWTVKGVEGAPLFESDLLFSATDLEHFAAAMGARLTEEDAKGVVEATKGWPLLCIYAVRLLQQGHSTEHVLGSIRGRGIESLSDQLLSKLSLQEHRLLLTLVLLDGALPEELEIAQAGGAKDVYRLALAGVPLWQSNDRRWRLHDVLRAQLLARCTSNGVEDATALASEFEHQKDLDNALKIAVASEAPRNVRRLLERHAYYFVDSDDPQLLRTALTMLTGDAVQTSPRLLLIRGLNELVRGEPAIAVDFLRKAAELAETGFKAYAKARLCQALLAWEGHLDEARVVVAELADTPLPRQDEEACEVLSILGQSLSIFRDHVNGKKAIRSALALLPGIANPRIEARTYLRAARVAFSAGLLDEVAAYAQRSIELGECCGFNALSWAYRTRLVATAPTDEAEAIDCARKGLAAANRILSVVNAYTNSCSLFAFSCRSGNLDEARRLRRVLFPIPANLRERIGANAQIVAAQLALIEENYWEAASLLAEISSFGDSTLDGEFIDARQILFNAQSAFLNHLTGNEDAANKAALSVIRIASQLKFDGAAATSAIPEIEISETMAAAVLGANGRIAEVEDVFERLTQFAHEEYRRDLARWTHIALTEPEADPSASAMRFSGGIIELIRRVLTRAQREPLTPTERRVLESLALGRSNKEIAAITGKSIKTVDNQVSAILRKLQARSRGEAVARARSTGAIRA